jgi:hypothetical protein
MTTLTPNSDDLFAALKENGRVAGFTLPHTLARLHGYTLIDHKSGWLLKDAEGLWKVRVLTNTVDFDASSSKGAGRAHSAHTWESGTDQIVGFIVADHWAVTNPELPIWKVRLETVMKWRNGASSTSFTRNEALAKLRAL